MNISGERLDALLQRWSAGDRAALDEITPLVYGELHAIASRYRHAEGREATLQTTELVHEAFLRLAAADRTWWANRGQFFALAARVIRNILVDGARRRKVRILHNGTQAVFCLDDLAVQMPVGIDLEALDLALTKLEQIDPRKSRVVELRFFGGLSIEQIAEEMSIGTATVKRHWAVARAWLFREVHGDVSE